MKWTISSEPMDLTIAVNFSGKWYCVVYGAVT